MREAQGVGRAFEGLAEEQISRLCRSCSEEADLHALSCPLWLSRSEKLGSSSMPCIPR